MPEIVGGMQIKNYNFTRSWGVEPGSAEGTGLVAAGDSSAGIAVGEYYVFGIGGIVFYGIISSAQRTAERETGYEYPFSMVDNRVRLAWARVFAQFNMAEDPDLVHSNDYAKALTSATHQGGNSNGVDFGAGLGSAPSMPGVDQEAGSISRGRLYGHVFPSQWGSQIKTYSTAPLSAAQILDYAFKGAVGGYQFILNTHSAQNKPVFNVDANSGMSLAALVSQISEEQGLQVTLDGQKTLRWGRRGGTVIPPAGSHVQRVGYSVSTDPTKVRIVGDRTLVQVCNLELEPDWKTDWQAFISEPAWLAEVARIHSDVPDTAAGRAEIAALAREITVRAYLQAGGVTGDFADHGRWGKSSRMDIPAWVYINSIVYRSYRIPMDAYLYGLPLRSLEIHDQLLCAVEMSGTGEDAEIRYRASPVEFYPQGGAYVIAQGQPLDLLASADRTDLMRLRTRDLRTEWSDVADFTLDALNHSIHFATPVFIDGDASEGKAILSLPNMGEQEYDDVSGDVDDKSDYLNVCVPNPGFEIEPARVRVSLVFKLGLFYKDYGSGARWTSVSASNLADHLLDSSGGTLSHGLVKSFDGELDVPSSGGGLRMICFDNGKSATDLADDQAEGLIVRGGVEQAGSYRRIGQYGTSLTDGTDRVSINIIRVDGLVETVEFAKPQATRGFVASREVARRFKTEDLFEGQRDLQRQARQYRAIGKLEQMALKAKARSTSHTVISDIFRRPFGSENPSCTTYADVNGQYPDRAGVSGWRAGDLLWLDDESNPSRTGTNFGGVVVTSTTTDSGGEEEGGEEEEGGSGQPQYVNVATDGTVPVACAPGITASASVMAMPGDWKCTTAGTYPIGMLGHHSAVPGSGDATLALVRLGAGGGGGGVSREIPLTIVSSRPAYIPAPPTAVAEGFKRFYLTWGECNTVLTDNWTDCVDIPTSEEGGAAFYRYIFIKAFLNPATSEVVITHSVWQTFTEAQKEAGDCNTPPYGDADERPAHMFIPVGSIFVNAGGVATPLSNGGGCFTVREYTGAPQFSSGAVKYRTHLSADRIVY